MAIIDGATIDIPTERRSAQRILDAMDRLRTRRYHLRITRRQFIAEWDKLRLYLSYSQDYLALRAKVCAKAHNLCERCQATAGVHVHHVVPVARNPQLALDDANCQWLCKRCHATVELHRQLAKTG